MKNPSDRPINSEIILYQTEDGTTRIDVRLEGETVWLTQKTMAEQFQKDVRTINEHIQNVFAENELDPVSAIRKFRMIAANGKRRVSDLENKSFRGLTVFPIGSRDQT